MTRSFAMCLTASLAAACATTQGSPPREPVSYGCGETIVVAQFMTVDSEPTMHIEDDILGHGWFNANLAIHRVLAGALEPDEIPVRYFSHAAYRHDRRFIVVLRPNPEAPGYVVRSRPVMAGWRLPELVNQCGA